jgi:hypothetical protein
MGPGTPHNPFARVGGGSFCVRNENYFLNREFECAGGEAASRGGLDQQEPEVTNDPPWRLADLSFVPSGNGQEGARRGGRGRYWIITPNGPLWSNVDERGVDPALNYLFEKRRQERRSNQ